MYIPSIARDLADGTRLLEFSASSTSTEERFVLPELQNSIDFHNLGNNVITLKVRGATYTIGGGEWKYINGDVKDFRVSANEITPFTIQGRVDPQLSKRKVKKPIQVATRCSAAHVGTTLAGTAAVAGQTGATAGGVTYRWAHEMMTECSNLQLVFTNFYPTVTTESSNANAITIAVTLEYNGMVARMHFDGSRTKTIDQGGIAITDSLNRNIPKGATFFVKVWVSVPVDGNTYPQGLGLIQSLGEGKGTGDLTLNAGALSASVESGYGPSAIIGMPVDDDAVAFALVGDSMVGDANGDGWPVMAVQDNYGYSILSRPGSDVTTMEQNSGNAYRQRLLKYFTHAICTFSSNDWNLPSAFATQEGYLKSFWGVMQDAGLEVYQATGCPRSTSSDNWNTVANQTVYSGNSYNTKRATFNSKARSGAYPVRILDVAAAIETSESSSGVWQAKDTGDGIHPVLTAKTAMVANIDLDLN